MKKLSPEAIRMDRVEAILKGDADAIAEVRAGIVPFELGKDEIVRMWEATIIRVLAGGDRKTRNAILDLGDRLNELGHPQANIYSDLFYLAAYPHLDEIFDPTIRVGAHIVRAKEGSNGITDHTRLYIFLEMAKLSLLRVLEKGNEESKDYAASALRHYEFDDDVRKGLLRVMGNGESRRVKEAAGDSLGHIRAMREDACATANRLMLLLQCPKDSPQSQYINYIYSAIDTVMEDDDGTETRIAVKQLATFGLRPGPVGAVLGEESLATIQEDVENALLNALTGTDAASREEAVKGLSVIGGDRVDAILKKIAERETKDNGARSAALRVLKAIQKKKLGFELPPPLPLRSSKGSEAPKARIRA